MQLTNEIFKEFKCTHFRIIVIVFKFVGRVTMHASLDAFDTLDT